MGEVVVGGGETAGEDQLRLQERSGKKTCNGETLRSHGGVGGCEGVL